MRVNVNSHPKYSDIMPQYTIDENGVLMFLKELVEPTNHNVSGKLIPHFRVRLRNGSIKSIPCSHIVANIFVSYNRDGYKVVKHKDRNYNNYRASNLIWSDTPNPPKEKKIYVYDPKGKEYIFSNYKDVIKLGLSPRRCSEVANRKKYSKKNLSTRGHICSLEPLSYNEIYRILNRR